MYQFYNNRLHIQAAVVVQLISANFAFKSAVQQLKNGLTRTDLSSFLTVVRSWGEESMQSFMQVVRKSLWISSTWSTFVTLPERILVTIDSQFGSST